MSYVPIQQYHLNVCIVCVNERFEDEYIICTYITQINTITGTTHFCQKGYVLLKLSLNISQRYFRVKRWCVASSVLTSSLYCCCCNCYYYVNKKDTYVYIGVHCQHRHVPTTQCD